MKKRNRTLFDFMDHQDKLGNYKDPLKTLDEHIDWAGFRELIQSGFTPVDYSKGGRPPYDKVMLFKILVLQGLYGLSDAQAEFQIVDRLSFMRFLGLGLNDQVPDQNTIRGFREILAQSGGAGQIVCIFQRQVGKCRLVH